MNPPEVDAAMNTFRILVDSREHQTKQAEERYEMFGVPYSRATLSYGDYCGTVTLPDRELHDTSGTIRAACVIERKMSLDELAGCLGRSRERFEREFQRARDENAKIYLLTENGSWEAIMNHRYKSRLSPQAFFASLTAWAVRYDMTPLFCRSGVSGKLIKEILYRDMKERLQRGEYG